VSSRSKRTARIMRNPPRTRVGRAGPAAIRMLHSRDARSGG